MSDITPKRCGFLAGVRTVLTDRRGAGAIEFALIAPVLILLYIGSAEMSVAMSINKKVARASSTVGDLVTRANGSVDTTFLDTMVDVANAVMSPYNESPVQLKIAEIKIDGSGNATIEWSWGDNGTAPYTSGSTVTIPDDLKTNDTYLIRTEMYFDHDIFMPGAKSLNISTLTMSKTYYLRPRFGEQITCSNCPT